ncbi:hypothetical protein LTR78_009819 [Recurvomyces mirabilis]|uniref:Uncharacterized protein n=1 Tax=Recurvomyces mirabilis TaxID=574656 RepID=A0AAE0TNV9_9PEZI|nr:hypothetical protein LTR78_009819 [Recurvomyces mirabilis]KAK5153055.1 hypothetical protein LTS14_007699 [Recurvomyces mirabilis]
MANDSISSLDPLLLPSSPLGARSTTRQSSVKPRTRNAPLSSPAKSFIVDTGEAGEASPWRIKVTVQAEPRDPTPASNGSPAKRRATRRTTKVPLKLAKSEAVKNKDTSETEYTKPQRKRKGTPIRRRTTRSQPAQDEPATEEDRDDASLMPPPAEIPTSSATKARRRRSLLEMPTQRGKRLSQAREDLDVALQEAVGYELDEDRGADDHDMPGDMTLAGEEDFTMVSVETLQSMKADTSALNHRGGEGDLSALSVSYLPSSPPKRDVVVDEVQYPDIEHQADDIRKTPARMSYDAMSWKPTGPQRPVQSLAETADPGSQSNEWRRAEETMSRHMEVPEQYSAMAEEQDAMAGAVERLERPAEDYQDELPPSAEEEDIWQEEASRSLEEGLSEVNSFHQRPSRSKRQVQPTEAVQLQQQVPAASTTPALEDLFTGQVLRPPRAKIPRTWRRTSGADFAYSDSPAHMPPEEPELEVQKHRRDASTDGGSRASSGMLTPTSTDDEQAEQEGGPSEERDDSDISLTRPDGEGTMMGPGMHEVEVEDEDEDDDDVSHEQQHEPDQDARSSSDREDIASPFSEASSSGVPSPDGEDTGMFWQSNPSAVYQRRAERPRPGVRKKAEAVNLSELLQRRREEARVFLQPTPQVLDMPGSKISSCGRVKSLPSDAGRSLAVSSPLKKSLLRSSKMGGGPGGRPESESTRPTAMDVDAEFENASGEIVLDETIEESWQSKASDQRQLLHEMNARRSTTTGSSGYFAGDDNDDTVEEEREQSHHDQAVWSHDEMRHEGSYAKSQDLSVSPTRTFEPSESYEERLNIESPQKIRVKFGDSANSSLLAPRREYAPLFGSQGAQASGSSKEHLRQEQQQHSPPAVTLVSKRHTFATEHSTGILSRLSTNFWSAVVRPTGPTEIMPSLKATDTIMPQSAASTNHQITSKQQAVPQLRAQLRSRYGVLPSTHPWTMTHMRTLHRMLNSLTSGKSDSIIPTYSPIPRNLQVFVNRTQTSVTGHKYLFSASHARVVDAFMQVLVDAKLVKAMRYGEVEELGDKTARSYRGEILGRHGDDLVWGPKIGVEKGEIRVEFLVKALGDVVRANEGC